MKKTYWWRILVTIISAGLLSTGYVIFYPYSYGLCESLKSECIFSGLRKTFAEPLFINSISLLIVSLVQYFVNDFVFKKWLKFAIAWFLLATIFITFSPVYSGGYIGLNPTKESVSIWMSSLFVIISLVQIVVLSRKQKKA